MIPSKNDLETIAFNQNQQLKLWGGVKTNGLWSYLSHYARGILGTSWSFIGVNVIVIEFHDSNKLIGRYTFPHTFAYERFVRGNSQQILAVYSNALISNSLPPTESSRIL